MHVNTDGFTARGIESSVKYTWVRKHSVTQPTGHVLGGNSASPQRSSAPQAGKLPLQYILSPVLIKLFPRMKDNKVNGPAPRPGCGLCIWRVFTPGVEDATGPGGLR